MHRLMHQEAKPAIFQYIIISFQMSSFFLDFEFIQQRAGYTSKVFFILFSLQGVADEHHEDGRLSFKEFEREMMRGVQP